MCALDLVSSNHEDIVRAAKILLHPESAQANIDRFVNWLELNGLLGHLKSQQVLHDTVGPLEADPRNEKLLVAMTLRDCTVFVRFPVKLNEDCKIEARLGDLDVKSPAKARYWRNIEKALIEGGWYMDEEHKDDKQPNNCSLNPSRSSDPLDGLPRLVPLI